MPLQRDTVSRRDQIEMAEKVRRFIETELGVGDPAVEANVLTIALTTCSDDLLEVEATCGRGSDDHRLASQISQKVSALPLRDAT